VLDLVTQLGFQTREPGHLLVDGLQQLLVSSGRLLSPRAGRLFSPLIT
jgi:hypothetical protein